MSSPARRQIVSSALWLVAIWLVIAAVVPRAVAAQDKTSASAPVLAEARALINQDKPAAAIEKLRSIDGPDRLDVALLLGVAYYHANDHVNAIERLAPIVDRLPDGSIERKEAVQVLGLSYFLLAGSPMRFPAWKPRVNGPPTTLSSATSSVRPTSRPVNRTVRARLLRACLACRMIQPRRTSSLRK